MSRKKFTFLPKSIIVAIVLVTLTVTVIKSCPLVCTCKWKVGKRKVEWANKNLTSLISNIESETQVLDYSRNHLHVLHDRVFEQINLVNLQKLYLPECKVTKIQQNAFHGLSNLIEIDLANNRLTSVPSSNFKNLPLLMKLILSSNPIRVLKSRTFALLKYLSNLDLSDCQIEMIEKDVFDGLENLVWLKLEGNKLTNFKFADTMPELTGGLWLHRNPWHCDRHLRTFHTWLTTSTRTPIMGDPICAEPSACRGASIAQLKTNDLACPPGVIPSSLFVEINEGKNISFVCQVNAVPEARITWEFEGNSVSSNSSFVYPSYKYYVEEATTEQFSELFVYDVKKANNGTYRCTAENVAGKSTSNYTLKVISNSKEMPEAAAVLHFQVIITSVSVVLAVTLVMAFFISCSFYFYKRQPEGSTKIDKGLSHEKTWSNMKLRPQHER